MRTKRTHDGLALFSRGPTPSNDFDPNHHIWRRRSLDTTGAIEARERRDALIDDLVERGAVVVLRSQRRSR